MAQKVKRLPRNEVAPASQHAIIYLQYTVNTIFEKLF
jgi:hypothetical protein